MFNWFLHKPLLSERLYAKQIEEQKTRKNERQIKTKNAKSITRMDPLVTERKLNARMIFGVFCMLYLRSIHICD